MSKSLKELRANRSNSDSNSITANKFYTEEQMETILGGINCLKNRRFDIYLCLMICAYTGARRTEIVLMEKSQINSNGTVTIFGSKKSQNRSLPLPSELHAELVRYAKSRQDYLFDFCPDVAGRWMKKVIPPSCKIKRPLHGLRHTLAMKIYRSTKDIKFVQKFFGHVDIKSSSFYLDAVAISDYDLTEIWNN